LVLLVFLVAFFPCLLLVLMALAPSVLFPYFLLVFLVASFSLFALGVPSVPRSSSSLFALDAPNARSWCSSSLLVPSAHGAHSWSLLFPYSLSLLLVLFLHGCSWCFSSMFALGAPSAHRCSFSLFAFNPFLLVVFLF
jgi:hypothetical protein